MRYIVIPILIACYINALIQYKKQIVKDKNYSIIDLSLFNFLLLLVPCVLICATCLFYIIVFLLENW